MDVFFEILIQWYKWIIALPFVAGTGNWLWKHRQAIREHALFFWNLKKNVEGLNKSGECLNKNAENLRENVEDLKRNAKPDPKVRSCPNCTGQTQVVKAMARTNGISVWFYRCNSCGLNFPITYGAE